MEKQLKDKWTKALRSGDYKQGLGVLYNKEDTTYCCMGVLLEVASVPKETVDIYGDQQQFGIEYIYKNSRSTGFPPGSFSKEHGLDTPDVNFSKIEGKLASMNDNEGKNFSEIADWIEKNL